VRLRFVQENLNYQSTREHAIKYLRKTHERYLPGSLTANDDEGGQSPPSEAGN
jgi:hypothetical protein